MFFDALAAIAERHMPDIFDIVKQSHLFKFPGRAHEILPRKYTPEELTFFEECFFLPFQYTAIEDNISCCVLFDEEPNVIGSKHPRRFIECMPLIPPSLDRAEFRDQEDYERTLASVKQGGLPEGAEDAFAISTGKIAGFEPKAYIDGFVYKLVTASKNEVFDERPGDDKHLAQPTIENVVTAIQEVMFFNNPSRFVVEKSPTKPRKGSPKKITRSHERPTFTLLTPVEIATNLDLRHPDEKSKRGLASHQRRRHFRTLRSERFTHKQGKTIIIPATWIGPTEKIKGNKRYKVRTDL